MEKLAPNWVKQSAEKQKTFRRFLETANKNKVLRELPELHEQAFEQVNCLDCAACCKNYSPRFKTTDIKRLSKSLRLKESQFIEKYLQLDKDGDYVTKSSPCPFLGADNACSVYDERPSDCARFPYTDEDVILKRIPLTLKNSSFCPAVFLVLDNICKKI